MEYFWLCWVCKTFMAPVSPAKWLCCIEKPDMTIWITNTQQIFAALNAAAVFFLFPFLWSTPDKKTKKGGGAGWSPSCCPGDGQGSHGTRAEGDASSSSLQGGGGEAQVNTLKSSSWDTWGESGGWWGCSEESGMPHDPPSNPFWLSQSWHYQWSEQRHKSQSRWNSLQAFIAFSSLVK